MRECNSLAARSCAAIIRNLGTMQATIEQFVKYLRYERNASPYTLTKYRCDMEQFREFITPPGEARWRCPMWITRSFANS